MEIDTLTISVFILLIFGGLYISWQGFQVIQGKRPAKIKSYERSLIQTLSVTDQAQLSKVLGGLRFVYGLVFSGIGIYFLITTLAK
jgi:threonine/homoserine/homoserine lactone efflux protein